MLAATLTLSLLAPAAPTAADLERDIRAHRDRLELQSGSAEPAQPSRPLDLSGPRIGATYVAGEEATLLRDKLSIRYPVVTQFGWQFEHRFFEQPGGFTGINEFIFLLGGLDQAALLPSASWLIGVRTAGGAELGAGPVLALTSMLNAIDDGRFGMGQGRSLAGIGFALAAGVTIRSGDVNFPFNLALVRSDSGFRVTLLTGFNLQAAEKPPRKATHDTRPWQALAPSRVLPTDRESRSPAATRSTARESENPQSVSPVDGETDVIDSDVLLP